MKRVLAAVGISAAALMAGVPAAASAGLDAAAEALRSRPVYDDPAAERTLSAADEEDVRAAIGRAGTPVYVAVLPASAADAAGGDPDGVARELAAAVGRPGTYAVVVGDSFRAGSSELPAGRAAALASEALQDGGDDTAAVLVDFVDRVGAAAASGSDGGASGSESEGDGGGGTGLLVPVLLAGGAGAGVLLWRRGRKRRAEEERAEDADRQMLRAELSVLADDVVRLEPEVQLHPEARGDFDAAVSRFRAAQAALEMADEPVDFVRVARVVTEAQYSMARVSAIVDGRQPPAPPEELQRTGPHGEPAVALDEQREPVYVGYPGGYQGGWFGGMGGGLFGGLLLGSMLGGGFGGWGYGGTTIINENGGGDGGGDWGGGDFGGGDFGGDFGGGDFGGGDFGGGDF